ncbi:hypothetical protein MGH68_01035 [Erysipelothrix sp. D19-032]
MMEIMRNTVIPRLKSETIEFDKSRTLAILSPNCMQYQKIDTLQKNHKFEDTKITPG